MAGGLEGQERQGSNFPVWVQLVSDTIKNLAKKVENAPTEKEFTEYKGATRRELDDLKTANQATAKAETDNPTAKSKDVAEEVGKLWKEIDKLNGFRNWLIGTFVGVQVVWIIVAFYVINKAKIIAASGAGP